MEEKIKELINTYELIIHGNNNYSGMEDNLDPYYRGAYNEALDKISILKKEIFKS